MKYVLLIVAFFTFHIGFSQESERENISIKFLDISKIEVLKRIEQRSTFQFYFVETWLDSIPTSGNYKGVSVKKILDDLFSETSINYFIQASNKIILTRNSLIRTQLPEGYFDINSTTNTAQNLVLNPESNTTQKTIRIGKEDKNTNQKSYILKGVVKNVVDNNPISNVVVRVKGTNLYVLTTVQGKFTIEIPAGVNIIETQTLGMESLEKRIIIYSNGTLNFNLNEDAETLDEIIIEADQDDNIKEAVTGITTIKIEEIKNIPLILGERDILKVATTFPGIKKAGEGSSGYNVRGGKTDQNLILLDNGVIYNPSHFFGIFSALNPFTSGNVDIYKGNIPAEYGGRLSSVFDINTKNGSNEEFAGEASIGPVTGNITLEIPVVENEASLIIGARATYSDWILKALKEESLKNSTASFYDVVAKYHHKINENNTLETTGYFSHDNFSINSDSTNSYNNSILSLRWNHQFNSKNSAALILANSQYKFNIDYDANFDKNFKLGYRINETELKLKLKYLHSDQHKFDYGISTKLYNVNPGKIAPKGSASIVLAQEIPKEKAFESAVFISDNFEINKKLLLNLGLRYSFYASLGKATQRVYEENMPRNESTLTSTLEYANNNIIDTYGGPEFRASARYFLSPSFSIKTGYNSTYQYIHTLSNNTTASPTDTWKLSDLNIKPQQATQYSLGFYKNLNGNLYEFSLEGYYKKSKNILDYKVAADLFLNETIETEVLQGRGKAYGIEFLIKKTKGKLNGWIGYSYARSLIKLDSPFSEERVNNGNYFSSNHDKPHDLSIVANYKLTKRFSLSSNFTYQTGRPVTFPVGNFIFNGVERVLYSDRNKFRIPDYYRLDLGINIEGNHKIKKFAHSFWNISVYNVLGRNNPYSVFFVTEDSKIKAYQSSIFSIPIPTITYNFKF